MLRGSKRVLCASAWFIYSGGAIVLSSGEPLNAAWGLAQLASAVLGVAGILRRQPRLVLVATAVAAVPVLILLGPLVTNSFTGVPFPRGEGGDLLIGLLLVILLPPLMMLWGALAMARAPGHSIGAAPRAAGTMATLHTKADRGGAHAARAAKRRVKPNTPYDSRPEILNVNRSRAGVVVSVASVMLFWSLQSEPRNVPVLLASAVALLYGLWLMLGGRATAGRMWGVLVAGGIGGVLGLLPLLDLVGSRTRSDIVAEYLSVAGHVGPYAAVSGLLFGLMWPEWWWRWGLILSWGFVVAGFAAEGFLARTVPLLLVPIPCLAAAAGALIRRVVPMLSNR